MPADLVNVRPADFLPISDLAEPLADRWILGEQPAPKPFTKLVNDWHILEFAGSTAENGTLNAILDAQNAIHDQLVAAANTRIPMQTKFDHAIAQWRQGVRYAD